MFGQIAARYDFLNHFLSLGMDQYWRWRTVRSLPVRGTAPVLDVCTGTGDLAFALQRAAGGEVAVYGSDFCHPMLVEGRRKRASRNADVAFVEGDALRLPFDDDQFQIVTVAFGLRNMADPQRGLAEMVRVCRPEGQVAVLEFSIPPRQPFRTLYQGYFRHVLPRIGQWLARNEHDAYHYLPASVGEFPSGAALAQRMEVAGLQHVTHTPLTLGVVTLYRGTKPVRSPKAESKNATQPLAAGQ